MESVKIKLQEFGYRDKIVYENKKIFISKKDVILTSNSLFFVDASYRVMHNFIFAISAPKYNVKGILILDLPSYHDMATTAFATKFNMEIETNPNEIKILREYGMRKIYKDEFDAERYILKKGFPDFPSCPYGHTFKMLGYDTHNKEYVRLHSSILKEESLKTLKYKDKNANNRV